MKPNVLFIMTDQQRFDTIAALGNNNIFTPNLDRLVRRGMTFTNAYSTCPVCVPARYTIRTGCEPPTTRYFLNSLSNVVHQQPLQMEERCGEYLARTMKNNGYRTFGIGKFHSLPWDEDLGYEVHLHSEELYDTPDQRARDAYAAWIAREHPEFDYIEALMGERTEMYYMPQVSPLPAELTVERWAANRAVEQLSLDDKRPYFGFISFIGPHPPFAPPVPFNRMYDPDKMENPIKGNIEVDHMDVQIPWMNRIIWADGINDSHARVLKARYYGEISYIDDCLGRILDAVESRPDANNTLICFFSDHGEMLGDHHAWQKECFFEASCHIPFLLSWPAKLSADECCDKLVCLTDLFGIATHAAGQPELREGVGVLDMLQGNAKPRDYLAGYHEEPGTRYFKIMIRTNEWKYIFMANGGKEQLFDMMKDTNELENLASKKPEVLISLRQKAIQTCRHIGVSEALVDENFKIFEFSPRVIVDRIYQFDVSRGVRNFPKKPEDVLKDMNKS